jgi:hypothetical protein
MIVTSEQRERARRRLSELGLSGHDEVEIAALAGQLAEIVAGVDWPGDRAGREARHRVLEAATRFRCYRRTVSLTLVRHKLGIADCGAPLFGRIGSVSFARAGGGDYLLDGLHNWVCCLLSGAELRGCEHPLAA